MKGERRISGVKDTRMSGRRASGGLDLSYQGCCFGSNGSGGLAKASVGPGAKKPSE